MSANAVMVCGKKDTSCTARSVASRAVWRMTASSSSVFWALRRSFALRRAAANTKDIALCCAGVRAWAAPYKPEVARWGRRLFASGNARGPGAAATAGTMARGPGTAATSGNARGPGAATPARPAGPPCGTMARGPGAAIATCCCKPEPKTSSKRGDADDPAGEGTNSGKAFGAKMSSTIGSAESPSGEGTNSGEAMAMAEGRGGGRAAQLQHQHQRQRQRLQHGSTKKATEKPQM